MAMCLSFAILRSSFVLSNSSFTPSTPVSARATRMEVYAPFQLCEGISASQRGGQLDDRIPAQYSPRSTCSLRGVCKITIARDEEEKIRWQKRSVERASSS